MKNELVAVGAFVFFVNKKNLQRVKPFRRKKPKTGNNDLCPCGSNIKYKFCCSGLRPGKTMNPGLADYLLDIAYD